jgi:hypothetical protein
MADRDANALADPIQLITTATTTSAQEEGLRLLASSVTVCGTTTDIPCLSPTGPESQ